MRKKLLKLALALTLSSLTANATPDITNIRFDRNTYNVSTITTSWDANSVLLQASSPWWGSVSQAGTASEQLAGSHFAYAFDSDSNNVFTGFNDPIILWTQSIKSSDIVSYAYFNSAPVAAPVPEADSSAMLLTGLGIVGFMARRQRAIKSNQK
jgi:hypothetical protein